MSKLPAGVGEGEYIALNFMFRENDNEGDGWRYKTLNIKAGVGADNS